MEMLSGKTALITGGAKGIGRAAALKMASLGARVAVTDIDEKALDQGLAVWTNAVKEILG